MTGGMFYAFLGMLSLLVIVFILTELARDL